MLTNEMLTIYNSVNVYKQKEIGVTIQFGFYIGFHNIFKDFYS